MPINQFNRSHPLIIMLEDKEEEVYSLTVNLISKFIKSSITLVIIAGAMAGISFGLTENWLFVIIPCIIWLCYTFFGYKKIVYEIELEVAAENVNKYIYGDEFSVVDVNNEKILSIINKFCVIEGKIRGELNLMKLATFMEIFTLCLFPIFGFIVYQLK